MNIVDLTYPICDGMLTFQADWHPRVCVQQLGRIGLEGRESRRLTLGTHTGTHIDAPSHFIDGGMSIDMISLDVLIGPITIVDLTKYSLRKDVVISSKHLLDENISFSKRMIFYYGWDQYWNTQQFFKNYPSLSFDAAQLLIDSGVKFLGYDTPSPDDSNGKMDGTRHDSPIHKMFLSNGTILAEYLANLDSIDCSINWEIFALPLALQHGDGAPSRIVLRELK